MVDKLAAGRPGGADLAAGDVLRKRRRGNDKDRRGGG